MVKTLMRRLTQQRTLLCVVVVLLLSGLLAGSAAFAEEKAKVTKGSPIRVYLGKSRIIHSPWLVKQVAVADPKIVSVQVLTPRQILLQGTAAGSTDIIMWSAEDQLYKARVDVDIDVKRMRTQLASLFPRTTLQITQSEDMVIVRGILSQADQTRQLRSFFETRGIKFHDMTSLGGIQQVLLQVRIAEVSRTAIRSLGVNFFATGTDFFGGSTIGSASGGALNPVTIGPASGVNAAAARLPFTFNADVAISPAVTVFGGIPDANLQFFIQAMAENQYLRILAEPTLVALSGQEASFLAGGKFPVPVVQASTTGSTSITIEYQEFGVRLKFRPTVLGDGTIELYVAPEVSEITEVGAVQIQGFQVPAIATRQAETTLQLKSGQTFAMAGLIRRVASARSSRVPWAGDIPVIGALLRSVRHTSGETELVVLVTASLVEPVSKKPPWPGITHVDPNDWELYALGRTEGQTVPALRASRQDLRWLRKMGLHRLIGPGAWARHGQASIRSRAAASPEVPIRVVGASVAKPGRSR